MKTKNLIRHNIEVLDDLRVLLNVVDDDRYARTSESEMASSIGKHVRHVIDHYGCFLMGLKSELINYDSRCRDGRVENSKEHARNRVIEISADLDRLDCRESKSQKNQESVAVICATSCSDPSPDAVQSTIARELIYLHSHAVHHLAIIRLILSDSVLCLGENFGVAPSTVNYEGQLAA